MPIQSIYEFLGRKKKEDTAVNPSIPSTETVETPAQPSPVKDIYSFLGRPRPTASAVEEETTRVVNPTDSLKMRSTISAPTGNEVPVPQGYGEPSFFDKYFSNSVKNVFTQKNSVSNIGSIANDFIFPEMRKPKNQQANELYKRLEVPLGKARAGEIANFYEASPTSILDGLIFGKPVKGIELNSVEKSLVNDHLINQQIGFIFDAADLIGLTSFAKKGVQYGLRSPLRKSVEEAVKQDTTKGMRKVLEVQNPALRGTQELDDLVEIVNTSKSTFSTDKIAQVLEKYTAKLENSVPTPKTFETPAQQVVYEDGIPVVRNTTSDTFVTRFNESLEAVKGNREQFRLSNSDVLQQEINVGSLPLKTTAEDTVDIWRIAPKSSSNRVRVGEEFALTEDIARSASEGAEIRKTQVQLKDLVRTSDGTFTYIPERLTGTIDDIRPPSNIDKSIISDVAKKEADEAAKKVAKENADKIALEKARKETMRPVEEAKAALKKLQEKPQSIRASTQQKVIKEQSRTSKAIQEIKNKTTKKIKEIETTQNKKVADAKKTIIEEKKKLSKETGAIKKAYSKKVKEVADKLRKQKQTAKLEHLKKMSEKTTKLQKEKERIRYQNEVARLRESSNKKSASFRVAERKEITELKESVNKNVDSIKLETKRDLDINSIRTEEKKQIEELRNSTDMRIKEIRTAGADDLRASSQEIKLKRGEILSTIKTATPKEVVEEVATKTDGAVPQTAKRTTQKGTGPMKPVGEGEVRESRLYETIQDNVRKTKAELGEVVGTKEYEFYRQATNKDQLAKAAKYIEKNGVEATVEQLTKAFRTGSDAVEGVLNNSLLIALEPHLLKNGMAKHADTLLRLSSQMSTRFGQEIQMLSVLERNNPLRVLTQLQQGLEKIAGKQRSVVTDILTKEMDKVDFKGSIMKSLEEIPICK